MKKGDKLICTIDSDTLTKHKEYIALSNVSEQPLGYTGVDILDDRGNITNFNILRFEVVRHKQYQIW